MASVNWGLPKMDTQHNPRKFCGSIALKKNPATRKYLANATEEVKLSCWEVAPENLQMRCTPKLADSDVFKRIHSRKRIIHVFSFPTSHNPFSMNRSFRYPPVLTVSWMIEIGYTI